MRLHQRFIILALSLAAALPAGAASTLPKSAFSGQDRQLTDWWFSKNQGAIERTYDPDGKLPPRVDRQLAPNDKLPPNVKVAGLPWGLERLLSPVPEGLERVIVGRHIVLLDRRTSTVLDVMREVVR